MIDSFGTISYITFWNTVMDDGYKFNCAPLTVSINDGSAVNSLENCCRLGYNMMSGAITSANVPVGPMVSVTFG